LLVTNKNTFFDKMLLLEKAKKRTEIFESLDNRKYSNTYH